MPTSGNGNTPTPASTVVREIIGRDVIAFQYWRRMIGYSLDRTQPDYAFWDSLRRGKAVGFEFAGLFCRPITEVIAAHVLGTSVGASLLPDDSLSADRVEYTNSLLGRLFSRSMMTLMTLLIDLYALGDQYIVVNADGSFSVPSPDTVSVEYDPIDYRRLAKVTLCTELPDVVLTDEYTASVRTLKIKYVKRVGDHPAGSVESVEFPNLIGVVPVVHFASDRSANELYGRPVYESMLRLLSRYDDLIEKGLDGAEIMGNPVPVISGLDSSGTVQTAYAPQTDEDYVDIDGNVETRDVLTVDTRAGMLLRGSAQFSFASPPTGFTDDIRNMLKLLFLLLLDHTRLPEALWGGAISSSKASADAQMPPFYQYIQGRRLLLEGQGGDTVLGHRATGGLLELIDLWLRCRALVDPQVIVAPVEIVWSPLSEVDLHAKWEWVSWLRQMGLITGVTAVELSGLVEDATAEVSAAAEEASSVPSAETFGQELMDALRRVGELEPELGVTST